MTDKEKTINYLNKILINKKDSSFKIKEYEQYDVIEFHFYDISSHRNDTWFTFDKQGNLINLH